ncbi:CerR family C-terminal domain-containing protein [Sinimarinibacterium flocculans]|uniref:CerR family C-terminal domain-containing protein n=1 Tax=Sinimarinibacterium flocculans TaxID=985250 RepID=UPI00351277AE
MSLSNRRPAPTVPPADLRHDTRSIGTRNALIEAAIEVFGRSGMAAARTRSIANVAGANVAAINYHFGSKRALYVASCERVCERMLARMAPTVAAVDTALMGCCLKGEGASRENAPCLTLLDRLTSDAIDALAAEHRDWVPLLLVDQREATELSEHFARSFICPFLDTATRLFKVLMPTSQPTERHARLLALTLMGRILPFFLCRAVMLKHMKWSDFGPEEVDILRGHVRDSIRRELLKLDDQRCRMGMAIAM